MSTPPTSTASPPPTSSSVTTTTTTSTTSSSSPTTSTSTSSTSTSSSSSSSSSVSSTSSSTSSSSSSTSSSSSSSSLSLPSSSQVLTTTGTGGLVTTITNVVSVTPSATASGGASTTARSDSSFFDNKGAVAGVFTVVGLIVLALGMVLICTAIRRRRAKKFDQDVDEAAREAAGIQPPIFLDDADDGYGASAYTGYSGGSHAYTGYSDGSHGAYNQPPMDQYAESYGMHNLPSHQPYENAAMAAAAGGAAGVGVARARSRRFDSDATAGMAGYGAGGGYSHGYGEEQSPYPAFAGPGGLQPEAYNQNYSPDSRYPGSDNHALADAAGMGMMGAAIGGSPPQDPTLARQKSQAGRSLLDNGYSASNADHSNTTPPAESYADRYQPGFKPETQYTFNDHAQAGYDPQVPSRTSVYDDDPYGGYNSSHGHGSVGGSPGGQRDESHALTPEESDDEDEHESRRVLKVANE